MQNITKKSTNKPLDKLIENIALVFKIASKYEIINSRQNMYLRTMFYYNM